MSFTWTPHRFAGGALALDVANSVILRFDKTRSLDRFSEPDNLAAFPAAAMAFSAERTLFGPLEPVQPENIAGFLRLREAIDRHFRNHVGGQNSRETLADLLDATAAMLRAASSDQAIEAATAHSALRLLATDQTERMKICGNCGWLFLDKSKNRSRIWCDMTVCGNRVKASRHYHHKKEGNDT
jgi:predicted RNA-binding Zn ribbon-like protein